MSSIWGEQIKISVFGESHGAAIGVVIDGLPPGIRIDMNGINAEMERRRPGKDPYSTPRKEADAVEIVSGFFNGFTTGTPLCGIIRNSDEHSKDYDELKNIMRPGHADYTGRIRYRGYNDYRGGGHFSGRLTAPIVFAGAIATQYLEQNGIAIGTHLLRIGNTEDSRMDPVHIGEEQLKAFRTMRFPVINPEAAEKMKKEIEDARTDMDSVGGVLETAVINLPAGLGSPMFQSVESRIASFVFAIPATKGIEFGSGFGFGSMRGSQANDNFSSVDAGLQTSCSGEYRSGKRQPDDEFQGMTEACSALRKKSCQDELSAHTDADSGYFPQQKAVLTRTNHTGGINGGITNGMPLIFRTAFRPTPSIGKMQCALDLQTMEAKEYSIHGRHDPCVALRAVPVMDAAAALVIMDLLLEANQTLLSDEES